VSLLSLVFIFSVFVVHGDENVFDCQICGDENIDKADKQTMIDCKQSFCRNCLLDIVFTNPERPECPFCRESLQFVLDNLTEENYALLKAEFDARQLKKHQDAVRDGWREEGAQPQMDADAALAAREQAQWQQEEFTSDVPQETDYQMAVRLQAEEDQRAAAEAEVARRQQTQPVYQPQPIYAAAAVDPRTRSLEERRRLVPALVKPFVRVGKEEGFYTVKARTYREEDRTCIRKVKKLKINLSDQKLTCSKLALYVPGLLKIQELYPEYVLDVGLVDNRLDDLPPSFFGLVNIRNLALFRNRFKRLPRGLDKLEKLEYLGCCENMFRINSKLMLWTRAFDITYSDEEMQLSQTLKDKRSSGRLVISC